MHQVKGKWFVFEEWKKYQGLNDEPFCSLGKLKIHFWHNMNNNMNICIKWRKKERKENEEKNMHLFS